MRIKIVVSAVVLVTMVWLAQPLIGQVAATDDASSRPPKLDLEALSKMDKDARQAAQKAHKQARQAWAEARGHVPSDGTFRRLETPGRVPESKAVRVPGTSIQYDTGSVVGTMGQFSHMVGNRFDSALNPASTAIVPVEASGSITGVTAYLVATSSSSAFLSVYSNVTGTQADLVTSLLTSVATGLNTFTTNLPYQNGTFLVGFWQASTSSTAVGLDTATTNGQGFHAVSMNDGATGTGLADLTTGTGGGLNAIVRVRGNVVVPVELMDFTIG